MVKVCLWTPESDHDGIAVRTLVNNIKNGLGAEHLIVSTAGRRPYQEAARQGKLKTSVEIYLKQFDHILFLLDYDNPESDAQRRKEAGSFINRIRPVCEALPEKVHLVIMMAELEAWLLVDVLGLCVHFAELTSRPTDGEWLTFANKRQTGNTETIREAGPGLPGVKEHLVRLSKEILKQKNRRLKKRDLIERCYVESMAPKVAERLLLTPEALKRNPSLQAFLTDLCSLQSP